MRRQIMETHRFTLIDARNPAATRADRPTRDRRPRQVTYEIIAPHGDYAGARARALRAFHHEFGEDAAPRLIGWTILPCLN